MPRSARRALLVIVATSGISLALAGAAAAHDCSSPKDCEQTAGYNAVIALTGGVVAVGAGLVGVYVGTTAGTLPLIPPAAPPGTTSVPATAPTAPPAPAMPPGYIHHEKWGWVPADEVPLRDAEEAEMQRQLDASWERNRNRGQDPELKAITDRIREAQEKQRQIAAEGTERERQYWQEYRDRNAEQAKYWNEQAQKWESRYQAAKIVQKGADAGVSIIANYTGPVGKAVDAGYSFSKTAAGKLAEGESLGTAVKEGAVDAGLGYVSGKIQSATGLELKTPNLANAPAGVKTFFKVVGKDGTMTIRPRIWTGRGPTNWVIGEGIKAPLGKGLEAMGVKKPDE